MKTTPFQVCAALKKPSMDSETLAGLLELIASSLRDYEGDWETEQMVSVRIPARTFAELGCFLHARDGGVSFRAMSEAIQEALRKNLKM